jgi:hypothetical protein
MGSLARAPAALLFVACASSKGAPASSRPAPVVDVPQPTEAASEQIDGSVEEAGVIDLGDGRWDYRGSIGSGSGTAPNPQASLDRHAIRSTVRAWAPKIRACYERRQSSHRLPASPSSISA